MRFNNLDLNLLVALDALLSECNITRAAERIHLSQSAMSNALGRLREYFDDELLVQVARKMEPTPLAQSLRDPVRDVLVRIDTTVAAKLHFDCSNSDREFTLSLSDFSLEVILPHALALATRQRSTVRFRLLPQVANPARALERGEIDLLIFPKHYCSSEHPVEALLAEEFVCTVWNESALAHDFNLEHYANARHVVMQPVESELPSFENWFMKRYGLSRNIGVTTYSFSGMPSLVVGTEFVATVHARLARRVECLLPIRVLPVPMPMPQLEIAMQWHQYRSKDPGLAWLRQLMRDAVLALDAPAKQNAAAPT